MKYSSMIRKALVSALVPLSLFVALTSWGLASPVGSSPDDDYHMASIWCGQGIREGLCETGPSESERRVPAVLIDYSYCYAFHPDRSAACPQPSSDVLGSTERLNVDGGYPPVFYAVMSAFASEDITASIMIMRTLNAFIFVTLGSLLFFLLPRSRRDPMVWGALVSFVPLGMFLVPSVNPSSWAVISAATLWVALLGYFEARNGRRKIALGSLAAVAALLGAGARSDAAVYGVLAMTVAVVLSFERTRRFAVSVLLPVVLTAVSVALFLASGNAAVVNPDAMAEGASQADVLALVMTNILLLPQLWAGALGFWGLGWLDTNMPGLVWVTSVAVFAAMTFWGLQAMKARKALALGVIFVSLVVIPMYILVNDRVTVGIGVQPRYIYPIMILLVGVALLQLNRGASVLSRMQLIVVAAALSVANALAMHINIRRYVTGTDAGGFNLSNGAEWWWNLPVTPMAVWAVGTVSFAAVLFGMVAYMLRATVADSRSDLTGHTDVAPLRPEEPA